MSAVFTNLNYHSSLIKKKQIMLMKSYKELLGTCIKSKKQHI